MVNHDCALGILTVEDCFSAGWPACGNNPAQPPDALKSMPYGAAVLFSELSS
jgi:hypothetical protein